MSDVGKGSGGRKPLRIFLSSTSEDLREYRARAKDAIERLRQQSVRMETFGASPRWPVDVCRREVGSADALVVIVAHRYGWVPEPEQGGNGQKSITRHEVEAALGGGKPVYAFVVDPDYPWTGPREQDRLMEAEDAEEFQAVGEAVRGLKDFKKFLGDKVTWERFTTPDDLAAKVTSSLLPWLLERLTGSSDVESDPDEPDLTAYLEDLIDLCDHISVSGISSSHARSAIRHPIEKLYTPLSSRGDVGLDGLRHERVHLAELLPHHDRLLIEGQPGAGKTTFLYLVATLLARDVLRIPCPGSGSWRERYLGLGAGSAPKIPVFVRISELVASLSHSEAPRLRRDTRHWLSEHLARSCEENSHVVPGDHWQDILDRGDAILLLDGLDEVADSGLRERIFSIFTDAARHWRCPMVVTSRPIATAALREAGFHPATIEPFGREEIEIFVGRWVRALHTVAEGERSGEAERYRSLLSSAITDRARVRRLASNPVMLTCLCVVHWNEGRLPEGRSRVYRAVLRWLVAARGELRAGEGFSDFFAWRAFARLALAMMEGEGGKRSVVDFEDAAVAVEPLLTREDPGLSSEERRHRARQWLDFECLGSGIVEELPGRRIRFWHLTFQEFLAALQLAWRGDGETEGEDWWPTLGAHLEDAQWRETVELAAGCLLDEGGVGRVDRLLERVLALRGGEPELAAEARVAGILGRLLEPLSVLDYKPSAELRSAYATALEKSLAIFTREGAAEVGWEVRLAAADSLGRGGDPRLKSGALNLLEVPGLDGRCLGKYPVTVEEYQRFVEAGGYEEAGFWSEEGWGLRDQEGWATPGGWEEQLLHPSRPVVSVSWYEAEAYCRWSSVQRGIAIRLPREKEWEVAALPESGEYPWGEAAPDEELANFGWNVGSPSPVGCYPSGEGRYGHSDLAGNVWEWCQDRYEREDDEVWKVLRGGGWHDPAADLRAAFRGRGPASHRYDDFGFRVLAVPASLDS